MGHKGNYFVITLLLFISLFGLLSYIFDFSGIRFYLEFIVLIGLLVFGFFSVILIYNRSNFGYILSAFVSTVALLNLVLLYFKREMSTLLFAALIAAMTAFIVSIVNIGERRGMPKVPVVLETYPGKKTARKKTTKKRKKKRKK
ncbi:hypothetical protein GOV09_01230 [Candidatus Woesearchaeota archaeon]|nr:hypothetical protein [Candidatus Woesearchaeota archaeon]